jgi:hypothetical protein
VLEKQARSNVDTAPFLRRVRYLEEATQRELVFLTNHLELPATTIAAVYKERWKIELLFKALKQNLRVKTFVGATANALKTQIWTALIALLAVKFLQLQAKFPWSLSRLVALLRQQLFVYRDLWLWIVTCPRSSPTNVIRNCRRLVKRLRLRIGCLQRSGGLGSRPA